jgi:RNA polymerase sigma-70 factor (ECF subfamily)
MQDPAFGMRDSGSCAGRQITFGGLACNTLGVNLIAPLIELRNPTVPTPAPEADLSLLLRRAQAGERDAFEDLYGKLKGRAFGLALRLAGRVPEAEELVQEVFVRLWLNRDKIQSGAHLRAWLKRVMVNLWITTLRDRQRWASPGEDDEQLDRPAEGRSAASGGAGLRLDLEQALRTLPDRMRTVLVLFDIYGYPHAEIAAEMGIEVGTSKVQLHRARQRLREVLQ